MRYSSKIAFDDSRDEEPRLAMPRWTEVLKETESSLYSIRKRMASEKRRIAELDSELKDLQQQAEYWEANKETICRFEIAQATKLAEIHRSKKRAIEEEFGHFVKKWGLNYQRPVTLATVSAEFTDHASYPPPEAVRELRLLKKRYAHVGSTHVIYPANPYVSAAKEIERQLFDCNQVLGILRGRYSKDGPKVEYLEAIAARDAKKSREHTQSLGIVFSPADACPYCGKELGESPHLDHIYPISRGGLSTITNCVYVCAMCNLRKGNKTLNQFVNEQNMNRAIVESRLSELGKEF